MEDDGKQKRVAQPRSALDGHRLRIWASSCQNPLAKRTASPYHFCSPTVFQYILPPEGREPLFQGLVEEENRGSSRYTFTDRAGIPSIACAHD